MIVEPTGKGPTEQQTRRLKTMRKREYVAMDRRTGNCEVRLPWGTLWLKPDGRELKRAYRSDV
jgi:hypothetical protein